MNQETSTPDTQSEQPSLLEQVHIERLRVLFAASSRTLVPAAILALICVAVLWTVVDRVLLGVWLLVLAASYGLRAAMTRQVVLQKQVTPQALNRLDRNATISAALTGLAWGSVALMPFADQQLIHLVFLGFVIAGVTASATPSLGAYGPAAFAFVIPCVLPLAIRTLLLGSTIGLAMGTMTLLYLGVVYLTVRGITAGLEQAVRLRCEADARGEALALSRSELQRQQRLVAIGAQAQADFIRGDAPERLLAVLLRSLLDLTGGAIGFIAAVERSEHAAIRLLVRAVSDLSCRPGESDESATQLVGACDVSSLQLAQPGETATALINQLCGLGCAAIAGRDRPLASSFGLPLYAGDELVGMIGLGSLQRGFEIGTQEYLRPLAATAAHIIVALDAEQRRVETQRGLDRTRSQLESCVTDTPASVAMLDKELRLIGFSQRWLDDFGLGGPVAYGKSLYEVVPEIPPRWRESFARVLTGQVEGVDGDPFIRSDGTVCWLRWESRPWYETGGKVGGLVLFSEDITDQKKTSDVLHARERLLEQLTDRVPGLLFQMRVRGDGQRSLLYVSSGSLRVLRMTPDVLIENPDRIFDVCCAADRPMLDAALSKADDNGLLRVSFRTQCGNGDIRWLAIHADATRLADGSSIWHGYIEDVTEHADFEEHCEIACGFNPS